MGSFLQDLRYAWRMLGKNPGFTAVATLSLALGIGSTAAVFSVVDGLLLRPLPYKYTDRLAMAWAVNPQYGVNDVTVTFGEFEAWQQESKQFAKMSVFTLDKFTLTDLERPELVEGVRCPANFFPLLGINPVAGRMFTTEEENNGAQVAIIGERLWRNRYGADAALIGRSLSIDGRSYAVIGILPEQLQFPRKGELGGHYISEGAQVWFPPDLSPAGLQERSFVNRFFVVGRLKPKATFKTAQMELTAISTRASAENRNYPSKLGVYVVSIQEQTVGKTRPVLLALQGAMGCVLLIACANVVNLLMARAAVRQGEFAIRKAIGCAQTRLIRQLLTESVLLAFLGGIVGLFFAWSTIRVLTLYRPENVPRWDEVRLSIGVLGFAIGISLGAGLLFGLTSALQTSLRGVAEALRSPDKAPNASRMRGQTGQLIVIAEIAAAFMLVASGGLMVQSLRSLLAGQLGFQKEKLVLFDITLPNAKYSEDWKKAEFFHSLLEKLRALPGVKSVAAAHIAPLRGQHAAALFIENQPLPPDASPPFVSFRVVSEDYFQTMGMTLVRGRQFARPFNHADSNSGEVVVNQALAQKFFADSNPLGKRVKVASGDWLTIVGVLMDFKNISLESDPSAEVYIQSLVSPLGAMTFAIRTHGEPWTFASAARRAVAELDKEQPITNLQTMQQTVANSAATRRFSTLLISLGGILGLTLAVIGVSGVISFSAKQRTREIGIRMALGATRANVLRLVVSKGVILIACGTAIGLAGTFILGRVIQSFLFGIDAYDPVTLTAATALLSMAGLLACYIPARVVTRINPMDALRYE
jgi:putative ABC transport system permease protein